MADTLEFGLCLYCQRHDKPATPKSWKHGSDATWFFADWIYPIGLVPTTELRWCVAHQSKDFSISPRHRTGTSGNRCGTFLQVVGLSSSVSRKRKTNCVNLSILSCQYSEIRNKRQEWNACFHKGRRLAVPFFPEPSSGACRCRLSAITRDTEKCCLSIFQSAENGRLSYRDALVYTARRTNRRIIF